MEAARSTINQVLVTLFNHILRIEEQALSFPGLSIREVHVIEAVCEAEDTRMSSLARQLKVTVGSISVAVSTLERKNYLRRSRRTDDRRVVDIFPTEKAMEIHKKHKDFHNDMVSTVTKRLTTEELDTLVKALDIIDTYFYSKEKTEG